MKNTIPRALLGAALLGLAGLSFAQSTPASSPAKKELVARVLKLQQPGIEGLARTITLDPVRQLMQQASVDIQQRVAADKRDAVANEIQADARKYADEAVPTVSERAVKLAPDTVGTVLNENFSEDELKQIIAFLDSPVYKKYGELNGAMQKALVEKLVADTRGIIDPKIKALNKSITQRLKTAINAAPAATTPAPAAPKKK